MREMYLGYTADYRVRKMYSVTVILLWLGIGGIAVIRYNSGPGWPSYQTGMVGHICIKVLIAGVNYCLM